MKISKVILVVAALHVLVIGGIFVFEGCSRSQSKTPEMATDESQPGVKPADLAALTPAPANPTPAEMSSTAPPATPSTATAATPVSNIGAAAKTYVVKKGDSLWKIAKAEGVSQAEIAKANNLSKNSLLKIGQKLQIPQVAKTTPTTSVATAAAAAIPSSADTLSATAPNVLGAASADADNVYMVKAGDSLWKIAQDHHVSVSAIKQTNNLSGDSLKVGQKLKMPAATPTSDVAAGGFREPGTYTENGQMVHYVEIGESPSVIAKKYGVKVDELMKVNNITDPKRVQYGQRLVIPVVAAAATAPSSTAAAMPTASAAHAASREPALAAPVVTTGPAVIQ